MKALIFCAGSSVRFGSCKFWVKFDNETCLQRHNRLFTELEVKDITFIMPKEQDRIDGILRDFTTKPNVYSVDSNHERVLVDMLLTESLWNDTILFVLGDVVTEFPALKFIVEDPSDLRVYGSVLHKTNWIHRRERWMIKVTSNNFGRFKDMLNKTVETGGRGFGCIVRDFKLPICEVSAAGDLDYPEDVGLIQEKLQPSDARWNY